MYTRRKRILFQLRLLDEREGRGQVNYDEDTSTECLQRHYDTRLDELSKQQEEKLSAWDNERQERAKEMKRRVAEKERKEKEEGERKEKEEKERMRMWRNTASLLQYDFILENFSEAKFNSFWHSFLALYPELANCIQPVELKKLMEKLSTMKPSSYPLSYLFPLLQEKSKFEDLMFKEFTTSPETKVEEAEKSPMTTVEITDAEEEDDILEYLTSGNPIEVVHKREEEKEKPRNVYGEVKEKEKEEEKKEKEGKMCCAGEGCTILNPSFNHRNEKQGKFCSRHQEYGMVDVESSPSHQSWHNIQGSLFDTLTRNDINNFMSSISGSSDELNPFINLLNAYLVKPPSQEKK